MSHWATLNGRPSLIIAHRGASGLFPEHTIAGYQQGLDDGADLIEPDLVPSRDGVLYCRHDPTLGRSTDIAQRPEFADRRGVDDWPCDHFTAAEIDTLRAIQPVAGRPRGHDRQFAVPRFSAVLEWAAAAAAQRGQTVTLYPEIKHPQRFAAAGLDPVPLFAAAATRLPPGVALRLQCFDEHALRRAFEATGLPSYLLLDSNADWRAALREHAGWLHGLAVSKKLLQGGQGAELIATVHDRGLRVDAWTYRDDDAAPGYDGIEAELRHAFDLGVDALFCDFPGTAVRLRDRRAR